MHDNLPLLASVLVSVFILSSSKSSLKWSKIHLGFISPWICNDKVVLSMNLELLPRFANVWFISWVFIQHQINVAWYLHLTCLIIQMCLSVELILKNTLLRLSCERYVLNKLVFDYSYEITFIFLFLMDSPTVFIHFHFKVR